MRHWIVFLAALGAAGAARGSGWKFLGPVNGATKGMSDPARKSLVVSTVVIDGGGATVYQVFRSEDGGDSWEPAMIGLPEGAEFGPVIGDPRTPNEFFLSVVERVSLDDAPHGHVYRSTDEGRTWFEADGGLRSVGYVMTFAAVDGNDATDLYATICGSNTWPLPCHIQTFLSQDQGESWNEVTHAPVNGVVRTSGPGAVYATADGYAFRSVDRGATWQQLGGQIACSLDALAVDPNDPETLYVGATETYVTKICAGIFLSNDGGAHWAAVPGFPRDIRSLSARSTRVVAGAFSGSGLDWPGGVFESFDRGATWTDLQIPSPYVTQVWLGPRGFSIYAATSEGLFRLAPAALAPMPVESPARVGSRGATPP